MKVIIFSHGHPKFSKGGGEIAAYNLFKAINNLNGNDAYFLARGPNEYFTNRAEISIIAEKEYIIRGEPDIWFFSSIIPTDESNDFWRLLRAINPNIFHFHHYIFIGLDILRLIKRFFPKTPTLLTLHEYLAICYHNGQLLKTDFTLCGGYSPEDCNKCFPDKTPEDFFLRERYIKTFFELVDAFISPSEFLKRRYVDWGIPEEKIFVIENGLPHGDRLLPRELADGEGRTKFAYLGQINIYKGLDIILESWNILKKKYKDVYDKCSLNIHGTWGFVTEAYKKNVESLIKSHGEAVKFFGPYESEDLKDILSKVDWVILGSIWYENSPVVIQEAFKYGRPVICPNIGGMSEKVKHGFGGLNFKYKDPESLADTIAEVVFDEELYQKILSKIPKYMTLEEYAKEHLSLYLRVLSQK